VDEGDIRPVEVIETVKINGSDDVAMVATYYSIWSSKNIDLMELMSKTLKVSLTSNCIMMRWDIIGHLLELWRYYLQFWSGHDVYTLVLIWI
jgi:hypothetical protein